MKFNKVRLTCDNVAVDLPLFGATPSDPYIFKGADGLGPTQQSVAINNGVYQGKNPAARQIVLRVGLNPNYGVNQTVEEMRSTLYAMLTPRGKGTVRFNLMLDGVIQAYAEGFVETIEPVLFSKDPEVQITIPCLDGYLHAQYMTTVLPITKSQFTIEYPEGAAPVGFDMEIDFTLNRPSLKITLDENPEEYMLFENAFVVGDNLKINTRDFEKDIRVIQATKEKNIIGSLSSGSSWLRLYPGENTFLMSYSNFNWVDFSYQIRWWGV